jgi:MarR family transcriptional regulator, lower aerobic nicotinate degradation pathway regulator
MVDVTETQAELTAESKKMIRAPRELTGSTSFLAKRLGMIAKQKTVDAFEGAGAVPYDYAVLAVLGQGACATQATIADSLRYDRSYLVGLLDELESRGLIERRRDLNDRRRHVVSLTKAGEKELVRLRGLVRGVDDELFAPLTAAERKSAHGLLAKLAAAHDPRYASGD